MFTNQELFELFGKLPVTGEFKIPELISWIENHNNILQSCIFTIDINSVGDIGVSGLLEWVDTCTGELDWKTYNFVPLYNFPYRVPALESEMVISQWDLIQQLRNEKQK